MQWSIKPNVASVPCYYTQAYRTNFLTILATALQWIITDRKYVAKLLRKVCVCMCVHSCVCALLLHNLKKTALSKTCVSFLYLYLFLYTLMSAECSFVEIFQKQNADIQ